MAVLNTLKGDITMSWFKHKPPKYPPHREPAKEHIPENKQPSK